MSDTVALGDLTCIPCQAVMSYMCVTLAATPVPHAFLTLAVGEGVDRLPRCVQSSQTGSFGLHGAPLLQSSQ